MKNKNKIEKDKIMYGFLTVIFFTPLIIGLFWRTFIAGPIDFPRWEIILIILMTSLFGIGFSIITFNDSEQDN